MSKPLEPQPVPHPVFLDRHGEPWYRWKDTLVRPSVTDLYHERKRLTLPELAAENHAAVLRVFRAKTHHEPTADLLAQMATVYRFATLPHAADKDYQ
jgi:hypothetical protein